jgi:hypothetical protein
VAVVAAEVVPGAASAGAFVAGTTPDRRPEGAPRLQSNDKSPQWYASALAGVDKPYPASLKFLDDQGGWYSPFTRPGMPGRYDIRGLHGAAQPAAKSASAKAAKK